MSLPKDYHFCTNNPSQDVESIVNEKLVLIHHFYSDSVATMLLVN